MGWIGDAFIALLKTIFGSLFAPFNDIKGFKDWIFGTGIFGTDTNLIYSTFTKNDMNAVIGPGTATMSVLAGFFLVAGVAYAAIKTASAGYNPASRTQLIGFLKDWMVVAVGIALLGTFYDLLFSANDAIVKFFKGALPSGAVWNIPTTIEGFDNSNILAGILIMLVNLGLSIWASFYYFMRSLTLKMLLVLGPIMIVLWMFPNTKSITANWIKELIGTIFVQSIHAMLYWMVYLSASYMNDDGEVSIGTNFMLLMLLIIFIPTGEAIKGLFQMGGQMQGAMHKAGSMMGMAALAGVYGSVKGAMNGKDVMSTLRGGAERLKDRMSGAKTGEEGNGNLSPADKAGTDGGATSRASKMLRAGEIASKGGKMLAGIGGTFVGAPMGPAGAIVASTIGSEIGGVVGRVGGSAAYHLGSTLKRSGKDAVDALKGATNEDLAEKIAQNKTEAWAGANEEAFKDHLKNQFPDYTPEQIDKLWDQEKSNQFKAFKKDAQKSLAKLNKGGEYVQANDLVQNAAKGATEEWVKGEKDQFFKNAVEQDPSRSYEDIEKDWKNHTSSKAFRKQAKNKYNENLQLASQAVAESTGMSDGTDRKLIDNADAATKEWAGANKESFYQEAKDAGMSEVEIQRAWKKQVKTKYKEMQAIAGEFDRTSVSGALVDKQAFTDNFANKLDEQQKQSFITNMTQQFPNRSQGEIEQMWETHAANNNVSVENSGIASRSVGHVNGGNLLNKGSVNVDAVASQIAVQRTQDQKQDFIADARQSYESQGRAFTAYDEAQALKQWNTQHEANAYQQNFNDARTEVPNQIRQMNPKAIVKAGGSSIKAFGSGLVTHSGVGTVAHLVSESRLGQTVQGLSQGFVQGANEKSAELQVNDGPQLAPPLNLIKQGQNKVLIGGSAVAGSFKQAFDNFKNHQYTDPIENQKMYQDSSAYLSGVIKGPSGYINTANKIANKSPYLNQAQQQAKEIVEIQQQAQTEFNPVIGKDQIVDGAVQLIVEQDRSYVQMTDKNGQTQVVSRYGSGDSTLKQGQVLKQNLTIGEDRTMVPTTQYMYMEDSSGGRIPVTNAPQINPNRLVGNHSNVVVKPQFKEKPVYTPQNQFVDEGNYHIDSIVANSANNQVRLVVERDRSYLVTTDSTTGREFRVSPYSKGQETLKPGERLHSDYEVVNRRIVKTVNVKQDAYYDDNPTKVSTIDIDPNSLVPSKLNKRYANRQKVDSNRYSLVGNG